LSFNALQDVISQKTVMFITTAVSTLFSIVSLITIHYNNEIGAVSEEMDTIFMGRNRYTLPTDGPPPALNYVVIYLKMLL
jgi:hypothetical protein